MSALLPIRLLLVTGDLRQARFEKPCQSQKQKTLSLREFPSGITPRMRGAMDLCRSWGPAPFWPEYCGVADVEALADAELSSPVEVAFGRILASTTVGSCKRDATVGADWEASPADACDG